jgi:polar amino acid transport system substrate-binding protein
MGWMKSTLAACLVLAGISSAATAALAAQPKPLRLQLMTESSPPISMIDGGHIVGSGTEKVIEMMVRTDTSYSLELLPWKRAYTLLQQRPDACLFSTTRTPERESLFRWVGPTDEADWILLGRADHDYNLHSLEDARKLRIGTYHGDARDAYLRERGFKVDPAPNDLLNPEKLLLDRIDLWAASLKHGSGALKHVEWSDKIVPVFTFNKVGVYLACNRAVPASLVARLNAAVEAMNRDGTMRRIDAKYEKWIDAAQHKP